MPQSREQFCYTGSRIDCLLRTNESIYWNRGAAPSLTAVRRAGFILLTQNAGLGDTRMFLGTPRPQGHHQKKRAIIFWQATLFNVEKQGFAICSPVVLADDFLD